VTSTLFGTLPALPRISVRLTASQLLLAKPGFIRMVECITRIRQGESLILTFRQMTSCKKQSLQSSPG
jgi:hypothetical protein